MNTKDVANVEPELWDVTTSPTTGAKGVYVGISGNTGAGKSTLIRHVVERARDRGSEMLGISERTLHHPYLRRMFVDPQRYAYPVQLNFMLHRHLLLLRQMELSRTIFMERSHFDDELFLQEHEAEGNISPTQFTAYNTLAKVLHEQIPAPDLLILMNPKPELSIERVSLAERRGDRPHEFPNEEVKRQWIYRWYDLYEEFHAQLPGRLSQDPRTANTCLLELDPATPLEERVELVMQVLEEIDAIPQVESAEL